MIERSRSVKCLGVKLDDGLNWKEQVQSVRGKCFTGLAKLRRLGDVLPPKTKKNKHTVGWYGTIWITVWLSGRSIRGN